MSGHAAVVLKMIHTVAVSVPDGSIKHHLGGGFLHLLDEIFYERVSFGAFSNEYNPRIRTKLSDPMVAET